MLKRINTRKHDNQNNREAKTNHRNKKTQLKNAIKKQKRQAWKRLIDELDNLWGQANRIGLKNCKLRNRNTNGEQEVMTQFRKLFPMRTMVTCQNIGVDAGVKQFTNAEVMSVIQSMKTRKAPGPGMITVEILKGYAVGHTDRVTGAMN